MLSKPIFRNPTHDCLTQQLPARIRVCLEDEGRHQIHSLYSLLFHSFCGLVVGWRASGLGQNKISREAETPTSQHIRPSDLDHQEAKPKRAGT